ncbi:MAG TPA: GNAT family N-acetyltransferase [Rhodocyclaceae bacterium]
MSIGRNPLFPLVSPSGVAIFGASPTPGTLGYELTRNLCQGGFAGQVHLINPRHREIFGRPCHPDLAAVSGWISLALIATPAASVPDIVRACGQRGARAAVIYSAGFRDSDANGAENLRRLHEAATEARVRIFGPKSFGYVVPGARLNATPVERQVPVGKLAFVSQSGAICASILDWSHNNEFGFSAIFSPGNAVDLDLPEILDFLAADPNTESVLLYLENLQDARGFLSAVRALASVKPVIAVKAGHQPAAAQIAEARSGRLSGGDDVFDAALRRAGVLRVRSIGDMFSATRALTTPRKPRGPRLAVVANGGGPAVMTADLAAELGITLAPLGAETQARLAALLPQARLLCNPVDVLFDASAEAFAAAVAAAMADPQVDGVLAILAPHTFEDPLVMARATIRSAGASHKPLLTCWMGEANVRRARNAFAEAAVPTFRTPENAVVAYAFLVNWVRNQALLQETPPALSSYVEPDLERARTLIRRALDEGRESLSLAESKAVLAAFHIPVSHTAHVASAEAAVAAANQLGYPVVLKAADIGAQPRLAVGGIRLNLQREDEVARAFAELDAVATAHGSGGGVYVEPYVDKPAARELRITIRPDRLFGPVIGLSEGGAASEIYDARSIALPPLNPRLVGEMIGVPHVARLLGPLRQMPAVAQGPLRDVLLRVSEMASELPWLQTLDISPLLADEQGVVAVDARIELRPLTPGHERYAHMAICPYPSQLSADWTLKDGSNCTIRPIRPEDATLLQEFVRGLSAKTKYYRFFGTVGELPQNQLARYTQIDYGREQTLIATTWRDGRTQMLGEANYATESDGRSCEFAIVVADDMAGKGIGGKLMRCLMAAARLQGLAEIHGEVMADNDAMLALMEALDFIVNPSEDEAVMRVWHPL